MIRKTTTQLWPAELNRPACDTVKSMDECDNVPLALSPGKSSADSQAMCVHANDRGIKQHYNVINMCSFLCVPEIMK